MRFLYRDDRTRLPVAVAVQTIYEGKWRAGWITVTPEMRQPPANRPLPTAPGAGRSQT